MAKVEKLLGDFDYKRVKQDPTPNEKYFVSTVWLGLDHSFETGEHVPLIFETIVFRGRKDDLNFEALDQARYGTETEALAGHKKILAAYTRKEKRENRQS